MVQSLSEGKLLATYTLLNILGRKVVTAHTVVKKIEMGTRRLEVSCLLIYDRFNDHLYLYQGNTITSFDFNPSGELVATIDSNAKCLVSDINTDKYSYYVGPREYSKLDFQTYSLSLNNLFIFMLNYFSYF